MTLPNPAPAKSSRVRRALVLVIALVWIAAVAQLIGSAMNPAPMRTFGDAKLDDLSCSPARAAWVQGGFIWRVCSVGHGGGKPYPSVVGFDPITEAVEVLSVSWESYHALHAVTLGSTPLAFALGGHLHYRSKEGALLERVDLPNRRKATRRCLAWVRSGWELVELYTGVPKEYATVGWVWRLDIPSKSWRQTAQIRRRSQTPVGCHHAGHWVITWAQPSLDGPSSSVTLEFREAALGGEPSGPPRTVTFPTHADVVIKSDYETSNLLIWAQAIVDPRGGGLTPTGAHDDMLVRRQDGRWDYLESAGRVASIQPSGASVAWSMEFKHFVVPDGRPLRLRDLEAQTSTFLGHTTLVAEGESFRVLSGNRHMLVNSTGQRTDDSLWLRLSQASLLTVLAILIVVGLPFFLLVFRRKRAMLANV